VALNDHVTSFIEAAIWHGGLEAAEAILATHPEIARESIHAAAILGDDAAVRGLLARDPENARKKAAPYHGDALVYLCFSNYLRLDPSRSAGFLRAANALLDAGASPNSGFWSKDPHPEFESALYGAAGVAHHAELTRLLLARGGDPNDDETPYHAPESYDNAALEALVESGKLTADNLTTMLLRKADWHDHLGIKYLLQHGADPNRMTRWNYTAFHQALRRDNSLEIIELMLDHGADPTQETRSDGKSGVVLAARRGRGDVLHALTRRRVPIELTGVERLIAACACHDAAAVRSIAAAEPQRVADLLADGARLLAEFAGTDNAEGVRLLLDLGVKITALYPGDSYFAIAGDSTALHVAAWKAWHRTVKLLIERGSPVNARDGRGRTPLALAVRACVDSYWTHRRSPESVAALLRAGASTEGIDLPTGYAEVDELLK
jgi:ankyrin repeat protein